MSTAAAIYTPREPTPLERELYLEAVRERDEVRYLLLFEDGRPRILWGDVYNTLSQEDRAWIDDVITRKQEDGDLDLRDY